MSYSRKTQNRAVGQLGEAAAERHLIGKGYRILERNYRCPAGEIDLIAEMRGTLVFVEVKTRSPRARLPALDAVDNEKQNRIRKAAKYYLAPYRDPSPRRFDVVTVLLDGEDAIVSLEQHPDAFAE